MFLFAIAALQRLITAARLAEAFKNARMRSWK
jgi:hypothetical protein